MGRWLPSMPISADSAETLPGGTPVALGSRVLAFVGGCEAWLVRPQLPLLRHVPAVLVPRRWVARQDCRAS